MILYISKRFETNVAARVHRAAIEEIYGKENIYIVDMRMDVPTKREEHYVAFGKYKNKMCRLVQWLEGNSMYLSNAIIDDICKIVEEYTIDVVFIEDSIFGNLVKAIKMQFPAVQVITFYHDIAHDLYVQWGKRSGLLGKIECKLEIRQEKINQKYSDVDLVFNKRDAELYKMFFRKEPDATIPIATPIPEFDIEQAQKQYSESVKELLFVGSKYFPNIVGIRWFYQNVLPKLPSNIRINIVGRGTEFLEEEFTDKRINVLGTVDSVEPYYLSADIVFAPLFDGGGMKCKSVEAISYGKCYVGTTESLQGFWEELDDDIKNKHIFLCNTVEEWVETLTKLLQLKIYKCYPTVFKVFIDKFSDVATQTAFESIFKGC